MIPLYTVMSTKPPKKDHTAMTRAKTIAKHKVYKDTCKLIEQK